MMTNMLLLYSHGTEKIVCAEVHAAALGYQQVLKKLV